MLKAMGYFLDKKSSRYKASEKNIKENYSQYRQYDKEN
jgi:hypothetical protein